MRTSEAESPRRVCEIVEGIFDKRLKEALDQISRDLIDLDDRYAPSQVYGALIEALMRAKAGGR